MPGYDKSRSHADYAVVHAFIDEGFSNMDIRYVFDNYAIGEKHLEQPKYLDYTIRKARQEHRFHGKIPPKVVAININELEEMIYVGASFLPLQKWML